MLDVFLSHNQFALYGKTDRRKRSAKNLAENLCVSVLVYVFHMNSLHDIYEIELYLCNLIN